MQNMIEEKKNNIIKLDLIFPPKKLSFFHVKSGYVVKYMCKLYSYIIRESGIVQLVPLSNLSYTMISTSTQNPLKC
jgi:hypothetical protein